MTVNTAKCGGTKCADGRGKRATSDLSDYAADVIAVYGSDDAVPASFRRPAQCDGVLRCTPCARQAGRPNADRRLALEYREGTNPLCHLCSLPGDWTLPLSHPARLEHGHNLAVARGGATSARTDYCQHRYCNGRVGDADLRSILPARDGHLPTTNSAGRWSVTPNRTAPHRLAEIAPADLTAADLERALRAAVHYAEDGAPITLAGWLG